MPSKMFRINIHEHALAGQLEVEATIDVTGPWYAIGNEAGAAQTNANAQMLADRIEKEIGDLIRNLYIPIPETR